MRFVLKIPLPALLMALLLFGGMLPSIGNNAFALDLPRVIPHSAQIDKPVPDVFKTLKSYLSDRLESKFELVSADEKSETIVAKQTGIDSALWAQWAACQTDPMHLI